MSDQNFVNLASEKLGARAVAANDDFFAPKENLVRDGEPIANDEYTDRGKWMDGWESRRRREPGYDWCVVQLGARGVVRELIVDTTHFKGNHPPECSVDACDAPGSDVPAEDAEWWTLLPRSPLAPDTKNPFAVAGNRPATHLRLNIYPDGGVARLRALGEVVADLDSLRALPEVNVAALEHGAVVVLASDMFFGHRQNLIMPGRATSMRDGWETRRRRAPGHDWVVVRLAAAARITAVEVDCSHFKGNAPGSCSIEAAHAHDRNADAQTLEWRVLVPQSPLSPHACRIFRDEVQDAGTTTHVRLNIYPDGGVSRLLVWGKLL